MRRLLAAAFCIGLTACQTQYGEFNGVEGVSSYALGSNQYRITARANAATDQAILLDYILLKGAETALAAGYSHFRIISAADSTVRSVGAVPGFYYSGVYVPPTYYTSQAPGAEVMIEVGSLPAGAQVPAGVYEAQSTFAAINPRIKRKGAAKPS